ncbi:MAG: type II/IV secretion system ATPase subunit [Candidatus Altiarchaeota archaeon]
MAEPAKNPSTTQPIEFTGQKKRLLDRINESGRLTLSAATENLNLDKTMTIRLAEELSCANAIKIEAHYLREPEFESINYKDMKNEVTTGTETKVIEMHTPKTTNSRGVMTAPKETVLQAKSQEEQDAEKFQQKANQLLKDIIKPESEREQKLIDKYVLTSEDVHFEVKIMDTGDFVPHYLITMPKIDFVTRALLDETKRSLIGEVKIETKDIFDTSKFTKLRAKFQTRAKDKLRNVLKKSSDEYVSTLAKLLVNEMLGLGDMEYLLLDDKIEEIVVNSSREPVWCYHKGKGWMKTNIILPTEDIISNYASRVAREVGREITHLTPLLDAHLSTGDRVNATLFPISTAGNTMTIRRFSRTPWSAIHLLEPKTRTLNSEIAAFIWLAIEFESSIVIAGGTASGKTSMLNAVMPFMPANQRIISIEDTRELNLPEFLHWLPMTTRPSNPEGDGGITMLNLLQNSLRMRPDRIIVGEVRAKQEAEVLFEAMHTGHSVYATFHAERAQEVVDRITSPPMSIPATVLKSLHLIIIQYRNRRTGQRRCFEICEIIKDESEQPTLNTLYKWEPRTDSINRMYPSIRIKDELALFTGMSEKEIEENISDKKAILEWMLAAGIKDVNSVGRIITEYYLDKSKIINMAKNKGTLK